MASPEWLWCLLRHNRHDVRSPHLLMHKTTTCQQHRRWLWTLNTWWMPKYLKNTHKLKPANWLWKCIKSMRKTQIPSTVCRATLSSVAENGYIFPWSTQGVWGWCSSWFFWGQFLSKIQKLLWMLICYIQWDVSELSYRSYNRVLPAFMLVYVPCKMRANMHGFPRLVAVIINVQFNFVARCAVIYYLLICHTKNSMLLVRELFCAGKLSIMQQ